MRISLLSMLVSVAVLCFNALGQGLSAQHIDAAKLVEKGNKHYNKERYEKAQKFYLKALEVDSSNAKANLYIGIELLEAAEKWKSLAYIYKAYTIDPKADEQMDFYLGLAYQYNNEFKKALHFFEKAKSNPKSYNKEGWNEIHLRIEQCKTSIKLKSAEQKFQVVNMGPDVNSSFRDYAPVIAPTQDKIILTSNRPENRKKKDQEFFTNIYVVENSGNSWNPAVKMNKSLNTKYDDMGLSFDDEGKSLLIYNSRINSGDIFISHFRNGKWGKPVNIGNNINTSQYTEASACLSSDGTTLFFTSNRKGGAGGMDIYVSYRSEDGIWGKPQNLGKEFNTAGNEEAPFLSADGNMLFFSSDGHPGIGGFDIYYSVHNKKTGKWSKPENMGFPVNSPQDDINFVLSKDGLYGYYSAIRSDTYGGEDIYKVSMSSQPYEDRSLSLLASLYNNAIPSSAKDPLQRQPRFDQFNNIDVKTALASNLQVQEPNRSQLLLGNIYFDMAKATIDSSSAVNLDHIAGYMQKNRQFKLELAGHTDNVGSETFNINLASDRAEAVFKYLVRKGINPSRLTITAYGKSMPLASNDDEKEGRELNRRVELNVVPTINEYPVIGGSSYASYEIK